MHINAKWSLQVKKLKFIILPLKILISQIISSNCVYYIHVPMSHMAPFGQYISIKVRVL